MRSYLCQMRPVLFVFYFVEILINMFLMYYHLTGFIYMNLNFLPLADELSHYFYLTCFYVFTVLTMFASVNLCTGHRTSILEEVLRPMVGFVVYTFCSLLTLADAESGFYIMYSRKTEQNLNLPEAPLHPYLKLMRGQAVATLVCSVVYLLHGLIALDVLLSNEDSDSERDTSSDPSDDILAETNYVPVHLCVLGGTFQEWLENFEWFRDFTSHRNPTV
ncbi:uncharacterized protein [Drosophila bipectinata]|uniref:uncharacterized protein n=1 Tax=Drosophila bipectinata TaxID=42026 RepID=UPI0007E5CA23|nr:uncharacterized protein LOC108128629 [Drosophila bipectinata]KAH8277536.1 hypothetical protein KR026_012588 [Drosophila bipectinata]